MSDFNYLFVKNYDFGIWNYELANSGWKYPILHATH